MDQRLRHELEARATRLERLGCAGPVLSVRAQLAALPLPVQGIEPLFAPRTAPSPPALTSSKPIGSEMSRPRASTSVALTGADDLDFTAGLELLPPGEKRARIAAINAACDLVPLLEVWQAARILGQPMAEVRRTDPRVVTADLVRVFGFGWSAGTLKNVAREWCIGAICATTHLHHRPQVPRVCLQVRRFQAPSSTASSLPATTMRCERVSPSSAAWASTRREDMPAAMRQREPSPPPSSL